MYVVWSCCVSEIALKLQPLRIARCRSGVVLLLSCMLFYFHLTAAACPPSVLSE